MYYINIRNIQSWNRDYKSVGVTHLSIESTMPKSNTTSDVVAKEAIRKVECDSIFNQVEEDILFLQKNWNKITEERDAMILTLTLDGMTAWEVSNVVKCSERNVNKRLWKIAETIQGCS